MSAPVVVTVRERNTGGSYDALHEGRRLCISRQPLLDAARTLLAEGADPKARIVMRRKGSDCLSSTIGAAAKLTVEDNTVGKPIFRRFRPRQETSGTAPRRRFPEEGVVGIAEAAE